MVQTAEKRLVWFELEPKEGFSHLIGRSSITVEKKFAEKRKYHLWQINNILTE